MFSKETRREIEKAAREAGIEPAALLAIAEVESGGRAFATIAGRKEPLIRFEGHYFDRLLDETQRAAARAKGLASPVAGAIKNPASQAARWRLLEEAIAIDRDAALQSVSWGIGQVMGSHWTALGYACPEDLAAEARSGVGGQVRLMLRFLAANGLLPVIRAHDWAAFARAYNGPRYKVQRYDSRIAAAYDRFAREAAAVPGLSRGDRGEAVLDLQRMLTAAGYPLDQDGRFGPATADAVARFQKGGGLAATGAAGAETMDALSRSLGGGRISRRLSWLLRIFGRMVPLVARIAGSGTGRRN